MIIHFISLRTVGTVTYYPIPMSKHLANQAHQLPQDDVPDDLPQKWSQIRRVSECVVNRQVGTADDRVAVRRIVIVFVVLGLESFIGSRQSDPS